jgi:tetratricopeptide (TPR) repeat protein
MRQLTEEGEPFLGKTSNPYAQYLLYYSRFLEQEARWEEARAILEQAAKTFEQVGNPAGIALSLNNIGVIYASQGKLEQAIKCVAEALNLYEYLGRGFEAKVVDELEALAICYFELGELEKARPFYMRAKLMRRFAEEGKD